MQSHYCVLGIPPTASDILIKAAYLRKAKVLHPDKGGTHDAFVAVQRAYDELTGAQKNGSRDTCGKARAKAFAERLEREQLTYDADEATYFHVCRCGDSICVPIADLEEGIQVFPCDSCSLSIEVS